MFFSKSKNRIFAMVSAEKFHFSINISFVFFCGAIFSSFLRGRIFDIVYLRTKLCRQHQRKVISLLIVCREHRNDNISNLWYSLIFFSLNFVRSTLKSKTRERYPWLIISSATQRIDFRNFQNEKIGQRGKDE